MYNRRTEASSINGLLTTLTGGVLLMQMVMNIANANNNENKKNENNQNNNNNNNVHLTTSSCLCTRICRVSWE